MTSVITKSFEDISRKDASIAGGKGASLGEMTRAGIPVPPGFVILALAFERFLSETDLNVEIDTILHSVDIEKMHTVEHASEMIQKLILEAQMPEDIALGIEEKFDVLGETFVAVRSSATAEDSDSTAWAGQLDSFLNTTEETLLKNVQRCWASLFTPRAIFYRFEKELHKQKISVAVVVQKMVESEFSGIAFSVHPVTEDRNQLIIEAGYGLGEAIVSGQVTPDSYVVEKEPRKIIDINISEQSKALYRKEHGGNEWKDLGEKGKEQVLNTEQILELSELIIRIENHYGFPCDIEWAYAEGKFYITQSRPITTLTIKDVDNESVGILEKMNLILDTDKFIDPDKELIVMRERPWMLAPVYWNQVLQVSDEVKEIYGDAPGTEYMTCSNGRMSSVVIKDEWERVGNSISDKILSDKNYFENIIEKTEKAKKHIQSFLKKIAKENVESLDFDELVNRAETIQKLFSEYDAASIFSWLIAGDQIKLKINLSLGLSRDDLDIISLPEEKTFASQMEREILESAVSNPKDLEKLAEKLEQSFYWILFGYDGPTVCDKKYFIEQIKLHKNNISETEKRLQEMKKIEDEINHKKEVIVGREKFSKGERYLINILHCITLWTDERKMLDCQLFYHYNRILAVIGSMSGASLKQMKYLFTHELKDLRENQKELLAESDRRMNNELLLITRRGVLKIASDEEKLAFKERLDNQWKHTEIKGSIASTGPQKMYRAIVRVLMSSAECSKVRNGEIMVVAMTTPDYVPAMKNALGFITDEGGVTCHAAIVGREMNKPCIIGTKVATKILKDGDVVEIDTDNGTVKILK